MSLLYTQLHMLGDGSRGAIIEMTLAKVLYMSSKSVVMIPFKSQFTVHHCSNWVHNDFLF